MTDGSPSADFWNIGHKAFKSTPETFNVKFIPGDVFDTSFLPQGGVHDEAADGGLLDISALTSLAPLRGQLSAIYTYSFFHLFSEEQQTQLAYNLGSLLSSEPGSMIFGAQTGMPEKGVRTEKRPSSEVVTLFCHSPESWTEMWNAVFGEGTVEVQAYLEETQVQRGFQAAMGRKYWYLIWSVTRV